MTEDNSVPTTPRDAAGAQDTASAGAEDSKSPSSPPLSATSPPLWVVVFLHGSRFAVRTPEGQRGTKAFATGDVVNTNALAEMMMAVPLVRLAYHGAIDLVPFARKRFGLLPNSGIDVQPAETSRTPEPDDPISVAVLPRKNGKIRTVRQIVEGLVPGSEEPHRSAIQIGIRDAVRGGYLERVKSGTLRTHYTLNPIPERIGELAPLANELVAEWKAFSVDHQQLVDELCTQIAKGIRDAYREKKTWDDLLGD